MTASAREECVSVAWLEDAIGRAHAHGWMTSLAYLEAVIEDVVFVTEMAATRKEYAVG